MLPGGSATKVPSTEHATLATSTASSSPTAVPSSVSSVTTEDKGPRLNVTVASGGTAKDLPSSGATFTIDKGSKWTLDVLSGTDISQGLPPGAIFSNTMYKVSWDKGRTSAIDGRPFWNFGDTLGTSQSGTYYGFSMGASFYGSNTNPLKVDTTGISDLTHIDFAKPFTGSPNPDPVPPQGTSYGMDTSNVAQVADGEGIAFAWEIFRSTSDYGDTKGQAMLHVTLGDTMPIATRKEGLLWGADKLQIGSFAVYNPNRASPVPPNADGYVYIYSNSVTTFGPVTVGRVKESSAFDHTQYQFLQTDGTWDTPGTIPLSSADGYGMAGTPKPPASNAQGSMMYNPYLAKYMLWTSTLASVGGFYLSDTPYGPWGDHYPVFGDAEAKAGGTEEKMHYGVNCHPELTPSGDGKEVLVSWGTPGVITMFKLSFEY